MNQNLPHKTGLTAKPVPIRPVTRAIVQARTRALALLAGRTPPQVEQADYEQARRELTGESDLDRQDKVLDALPEEKRWDPVPGSAGRQRPESPSEDEDAEGRSETELAVDAGVEAAERDQMRQAARAAAKNAQDQP